MARRKAAGKKSRAVPRRPAGGARKSTRKPTARKAARVRTRAAKAAPPRKRPPAKARKPRGRAAPRPGGRVRKAARTAPIKETLPEEPGEALDPALAEQARGETALLGRGPIWWNSSLGGAKPGARVPPALRRGAGEDDPEKLAVQPPIPIGIFALRERSPAVEPDAFEEPESPAARADPASPAARGSVDAPATIEAADGVAAAGGEDDAAPVDAAEDEPPAAAGLLDELPSQPQRQAVPLDDRADAGLAHAAPSSGGVMQMLLGTVARSRPDGPGDVPPPEPVHPSDRAVPAHSPAEAPKPMHAPHGARVAPLPGADEAGLPGRTLAPADLEALDAEIASSMNGLDGLDGAEEVLPRTPRGSAGLDPAPADPGPRPLRPAGPMRGGPGGAPVAEPRAARPRGGVAAPPPKTPSVLVTALAAFNYPLRVLPPSARRIVGWIAASLLLWVPIVWLIAIYFIGR